MKPVQSPCLAALVLLSTACGGPRTTASIRGEHGERVRGDADGLAVAAAGRASREIPCPESALEVETLGAGGYVATGCGTRITYTCAHGRGTTCAPSARESADGAALADLGKLDPGPEPQQIEATAPPPRGDAITTWTDDHVRELNARMNDALVGCFPQNVTSARVQVRLLTTGGIRRLSVTPEPGPAVAQCLDTRLGAERLVASGPVRDAREATLELTRPEPTPVIAPRPFRYQPRALDAIRRTRDDVLACSPVDLETIRVAVIFSPQGAIRHVTGQTATPLPADASACVARVLQAQRVEPRRGEPEFVVLEYRRGELPATETPPPPPTPAPSTEPPSPTVEAAARAAIDQRAPAILACVATPAVALQVSWDAHGQLDAIVRGAPANSPEEGCVRAVVRTLRIPAPGGAGVMVHALQR